MTTPILMPALSPTTEEGKLVKWHVKEGDTVRSGDVIAEIETDKATMEVEAVDEGTMGRLLVPEGTEHVPVNQPIALLLEDGEDEAAAAPRASSFETRPAAAPQDEGSTDQRAGPTFTLMRISFHSPSPETKSISKETRDGSVGKKPRRISLPSAST